MGELTGIAAERINQNQLVTSRILCDVTLPAVSQQSPAMITLVDDLQNYSELYVSVSAADSTSTYIPNLTVMCGSADFFNVSKNASVVWTWNRRLDGYFVRTTSNTSTTILLTGKKLTVSCSRSDATINAGSRILVTGIKF